MLVFAKSLNPFYGHRKIPMKQFLPSRPTTQSDQSSAVGDDVDQTWNFSRETRDMITQAIIRLQSHEVLCTERWRLLEKAIGKMDEKIDQLMTAHNQSTGYYSLMKYMGHFLSALIGAIVAWILRGGFNG